MSPGTHVIKEKLNPIPGHNEMRTKIWGVKCITGLRYKQVGMKKYCITQAVLEPNPYMKDEGNFVSVMVVHDNGEEHLMAVLRHGQIYQVNLNMLFDRDKDVAFYLVGRGTVYLLGYEVILPKKDRGKESSPKGVKESPPKIKEVDLHLEESDSSPTETPPQKHSKSLKSGKKKKKSVEQETPEKSSAVEMDDDEDNEDDSDFCVGDDEFESSESEYIDESEEEVEVDESEVESLVAKTEVPEPLSASKKRKLIAELQQTLKRSKMDEPKKTSSPKKSQIAESNEEDSSKEDSSSKEETSIKENNTSKEEEEDSVKELSESDAVSSCNGISPKASKFEEKDNSAEKKKKKKKKKKGIQETAETPQKTNKVQKTKSPSNKALDLIKLRNGLEIQDLKVGHGPTASRGKVVHVFYVGRLPDKTIFDSQLPGKKPLSFKLGANQVLKGLDIGLEGMKTGGKRKIKVPPIMGYGNKASSGVPPNSTLYFIVDLQAVS